MEAAARLILRRLAPDDPTHEDAALASFLAFMAYDVRATHAYAKALYEMIRAYMKG